MAHSNWLMWLCYSLGQYLHVAVQLRAIANAPNSHFSKSRQILADRWPNFAARMFLATMLFLLFWDNPGVLPKLLGYAGFTISQNLADILSLPMSAAIAGIYGWASDSLLGYIPGLKSTVPSVNGFH